MRAREFTINIPINIKISGDGQPEVDLTQDEPADDDTGTFVPPLQQKIELLKKSTGVKSVYDDNETPSQNDNTVVNYEASDDEPLE